MRHGLAPVVHDPPLDLGWRGQLEFAELERLVVAQAHVLLVPRQPCGLDPEREAAGRQGRQGEFAVSVVDAGRARGHLHHPHHLAQQGGGELRHGLAVAPVEDRGVQSGAAQKHDLEVVGADAGVGQRGEVVGVRDRERELLLVGQPSESERAVGIGAPRRAQGAGRELLGAVLGREVAEERHVEGRLMVDPGVFDRLAILVDDAPRDDSTLVERERELLVGGGGDLDFAARGGEPVGRHAGEPGAGADGGQRGAPCVVGRGPARCEGPRHRPGDRPRQELRGGARDRRARRGRGRERHRRRRVADDEHLAPLARQQRHRGAERHLPRTGREHAGMRGLWHRSERELAVGADLLDEPLEPHDLQAEQARVAHRCHLVGFACEPHFGAAHVHEANEPAEHEGTEIGLQLAEVHRRAGLRRQGECAWRDHAVQVVGQRDRELAARYAVHRVDGKGPLGANRTLGHEPRVRIELHEVGHPGSPHLGARDVGRRGVRLVLEHLHARARDRDVGDAGQGASDPEGRATIGDDGAARGRASRGTFWRGEGLSLGADGELLRPRRCRRRRERRWGRRRSPREVDRDREADRDEQQQGLLHGRFDTPAAVSICRAS